MRKEAGFGSLPASVQRGIRKAVTSEKPFILAPFSYVAKKMVGSKKVDDFFWNYLQKPLVKADIAAGSGLKKLTKKLTGRPGKLWEDNMLLPMKKPYGKTTGHVEYAIPSGLAPISKASKIIIPLLGANKLEEMLTRNKKMDNKPVITKADLQKTAAMLTNLHAQNQDLEKEARAIKLLYKQAELGQIVFPKTHVELTEKVAELKSKDLNVVEEAIKLASSNDDIAQSFGGLGSESSYGGSANESSAAPISGSARKNFERSLLEN